MGVTVGFTLKLLSREANVTPGPLPEECAARSSTTSTRAPQRAILRLYRSSPPERLAAAGAHLGDVRAPTLVALGRARPVHPRALRPRVRRRSRTPSCSSCPTPATGPGSTAPTCPRACTSSCPADARLASRSRATGGRAGGPRRRRRRAPAGPAPPAWLLAAVMAVTYLVLAPSSPRPGGGQLSQRPLLPRGLLAVGQLLVRRAPPAGLLAAGAGARRAPRAAVAGGARGGGRGGAVRTAAGAGGPGGGPRARRGGSPSAPASRCCPAASPTTSAWRSGWARCCCPAPPPAAWRSRCAAGSLASPVAGAFLALALRRVGDRGLARGGWRCGWRGRRWSRSGRSRCCSPKAAPSRSCVGLLGSSGGRGAARR